MRMERFLLRSISSLEFLLSVRFTHEFGLGAIAWSQHERLQLGILVCAMSGYKVDAGNAYA